MNRGQNIYFFGTVCTDSYARHIFSAHSLVYLYSGQLHLQNQCGEALTVGRGECAFIGRDSYSHLYAEPDADEPCRMTFFSLTRQFLCEFYQTLDPARRKKSTSLCRRCICCRTDRKSKVSSTRCSLISGAVGNSRTRCSD